MSSFSVNLVPTCTRYLQVRSGRPARERTMDDVEGVLIHQQGLMSSFIEKVKRALTHLDREMQQLEHVRVKLEADLRDKVRGYGKSVGTCVEV